MNFFIGSDRNYMNYRKKQAGGTFLGFILGLIVGLGIAVAVAMTINKTPIPFVDRGFKPPKEAATQSGEMPDLNKSLYGNVTPSRQAAEQLQKQAEPPAEPAAVPPPGAAVAPAQEPARAAEEKWTYYLQAGAFRAPADAENAKAKLALLGVESSVSERNDDSGTLYRVRIGPFAQIDAMNRVRTKLSESGVDVAVVRIQK